MSILFPTRQPILMSALKQANRIIATFSIHGHDPGTVEIALTPPSPPHRGTLQMQPHADNWFANVHT